MSSRRSTLSASMLASAIACVWHAAPAYAQAAPDDEPARGEPAWSVAASPAYQFGTDLDDGDELHVNRLLLAATGQAALGSRLRATLSLRYELEDWDFGSPAAFGGIAPWEQVHRATLGAQFSRSLNNGWQISAGPTLELAAEDGASASDSFVYGGVLSAARRISPQLTLGFGAAVLREIEETRVWPIVIVSWRINDRLWLRNSLPNGPTGPAGVELAYRLTDQWEIAGGGGLRRMRFRLDDEGPSAGGIGPTAGGIGPTAGGIGESRSLPVYARATRSVGRSATLSMYAGALLGGELRMEDADGRELAEDEHDPAPIVALSLSSRF